MLIECTSIIESIVGEQYFCDDITIDELRCNSICHKDFVCSRCADVCPTGALKIEVADADSGVGVGVTIDTSKCTHCGACVVACPAEALYSEWFSYVKLLKSGAKSISKTHNQLVVVCSQALEENEYAQQRIDKGGFVVVPCLARIDESYLLSLAALGANIICMAHGKCELCKSYLACKSLIYGSSGDGDATRSVPIWQQVADSANQMFGGVGSNAHAQAMSISQAPNIDQLTEAREQITRRELMSFTQNKAKDVALDMLAEAFANSQYGDISEFLLGDGVGVRTGQVDSTIFDDFALNGATMRTSRIIKKLVGASRQKVCEWALVSLALSNHESAEVALEHVGKNKIRTRIFSNITIDEEKCNRCMQCVAYCKSNAISTVQDKNKVLGLKLSHNLCKQCGICVNVCPKEAIVINSQVKVADILCEKTDTILF